MGDRRRAPTAWVAAGVGLLVLAGVAGPVAPPAHAEPRPTIASVERQVAALEVDVENAAEAANEARARLVEVQHRLARLQDRLATERLDLERISAGLGHLASQVYRGGGLDLDVQVLLATDPSDFMARIATIDHVASTQQTVLRRTRAARNSLAATEAAVEGEQATASALRLQAEAHQRDADQTLARSKALLLTLREEERRRLAEIARQKRLAQIARAKAAAAALRRAQAQARAEAAARAREEARAVAAAAARRRTSESSGNAGTGGPADAGGGGSVPVVTGSGRGSDAVQAALGKVGHPYVAGGRGPDVFDCSGFTAWAWAQAGVSLVPYSFTQWDETQRVSRGQARAGDLVFFFRDGAHHVGMYLGDGQMVHAANPSSGVIVSSIDESWYAARLSGFGRVGG